jgi:CHAT domain-containing protein
VSFHTALALAPGNGEDGFVTPGELTRLQLAADLVVLSACRTAGGVVVDGEGVQGLTAPLLAAGARSVVATSWRVGDERTVGLVEDFYAELARGRPVIEALQTAKLEALHRRTPAAVWGAFTVFGDPLVTIPLRGAPG